MNRLFQNLLVRNASWLLAANSIVKLITFFYTILLARYLGPSDYGLYIYALTIFGIIMAVSDLGLARYLTRELSKETSKITTFPVQILLVSTISSLIFLLISSTLFLLFDPQKIRVFVTLIMLFAVIPNTQILIIQSIFTANEKMKLVAISMLGLSIASSILGIFVIFSGAKILTLALSFAISHILILGVNFYLIKKQHLNFNIKIDFNFYKTAIKNSLPYAVLTLIGLLYFRVDVILLSIFKNNAVTGYYGAAFRFLDAVHFIPLAISTAIFPLMSRLHYNSVGELKNIYFKTTSILFVLSIPITFIFFFGAEFLINLLYGPSFNQSIPVLRILAFTIPFMFLHVPGSHLLFASEQYLNQVLALSIVTVVFNITGNLMLIPKYGQLAASWVTVASEVLSFLLFFGLIWFKVFGNKKK